MNERRPAAGTEAVRAILVIAAIPVLWAAPGHTGSRTGGDPLAPPAGAGLSGPSHPPTPAGTLGARARRIAATDPDMGEHYFWLSAGEVLLPREPDATGFKLTLLDRVAGTDTPLAAFNESFKELVVRNDSLGPPALSPDRKRLLWLSAHTRSWVAATLDGKEKTVWPEAYRENGEQPREAPVRGVWLADSRRWIEVRLRLDDLTIVAVLRTIEDPSVSRPIRMPDGELRGAVKVLGLTPQGRLLLCRPEAAPSFTELAIEGDAAVFHPRSIRAPANWREVVLSPAGDRLAWLCGTGGGFNPFDRKSEYQPPSDYWVQVSAADGSDVRQVGRTRLNVRKSGKEAKSRYDHPWALRWVPDGQEVSFLFGDGLFVAPVHPAD